MANRRTPKPTGRRVRGYISDLVELSAPRALWTALVYHQDFRDDDLLTASAERVSTFAEAGCPGIPPLVLRAPGVFAYDTGEIRSTRELLGASRGGIGWKATTAWFIGAATALAEAATASGLPNHGSLDPHRVLIGYDGKVSVIGFGLPRLDLVDFLDDASLLPPSEAIRYTAPESLEGAEEDFGTDLFVLGLIAARLGAGIQIYPADTPTELIAAAAEGEARRVLTSHAPPDAVMAWLAPVLEPWPEERPGSIAAAVATARASLETIEGDDLATVMDALAETASDVEVDLPRGWKLPVPPPPLDEEHRDKATRRLKRVLGESQRAVERTRARLDPIAERDWSLDARAAEARREAEHHLKAAQRAVDDARAALERAEQAATTESLDAALAEGEDACDRARGANAEGLRAIDRATSALDAAEAEVEKKRRADRADRATTLVAEVEALVGRLDALDDRTPRPITGEARTHASELELALQAYADEPEDADALEALQGRVESLRQDLGSLERRADDEAAEAIRQAELAAEEARRSRIAEVDARIATLEALSPSWEPLREEARKLGPDEAFDRLHRELLTRLGEARELQGAPDPLASRNALDAIAPVLEGGADRLAARLAELRETRRRQEAEAARRRQVEEELARLRDRAAVLAEQAESTNRGLSLAHGHADPVVVALDDLRESLQDARRAAEALAGLELEPDDDPEAVLDAAQTHLAAAEQAAERTTDAAERARAADAAETARLDHEQAERAAALVRFREQLAATGERVRKAAGEVRGALSEAEGAATPLLEPLTARGSIHLGPLERALDALRQHQALLVGRQTNWEQMAEPAPSTDDLEQLEALVATGEAEAGFAEADLTDLPDLVDAFTSVLALARAEQQVHEDALAAARERIDAAFARADEAEALLPGRTTIPSQLSDDPQLQGLEDELLRAGEAARSSLATVRAAAAQLDPDRVPEERWLEELERTARLATRRADEAAGVHRSLVEAIERELAAREAERAALEAARQAARTALASLCESDEAADVEIPEPTDPAVAERVADRIAELRERLDALEPLPDVDLESDPRGARDLLEPLVQPRRLASEAIVAAHAALLDTIRRTSELVSALRQATRRGEEAADRAAVASATARELVQGLMGSWAHLEEPQQELRARVEDVDRAASGASEAAERASDATRAEEALDAATAAEAAADEAERVLQEAQPLAEALSAEVEKAREQAAEADEQRRLELIEEARQLTSTLHGLREALDLASREAVTALEDSPSTRARALWEEAEGPLDEANALLARIDGALQGVFSASSAEEAAELLGPCRTWLGEATETLDPARSALQATTTQARRDVAANEQLVVDLQGTRIELDGVTGEVEALRGQLVERSQSMEADEPDPALTEALDSIDEQLGHLASAREALAEALSQAMGAEGETTRTALRKSADQSLARANAARNTSRALGRRLEEHLAQLEAAESERRNRAVQRITQQHQALVDQLDRLRGVAAIALDSEDAASLHDAVAAVERALEACTDLQSGSEVRLEQADPESPARVLEHLVRQGQRALERLEERGKAVRAAVDAVDQARRARAEQLEAAYRAWCERHEALHSELLERVQEATDAVREARSGLESARPLLANSPAASARKAWDAAQSSVTASESALQSARDALQGWPAAPSFEVDESARDATRSEAVALAETLRGHVSTAIAEAGAVAGRVDTGLRSAQALAGILDDAGQVRGRYQTFEGQLEGRRVALVESMADAPTTRASRLHEDARVQIEEIDQTLAEARASLEELGEATSAEQAEALLQVAVISLDIAESVLEYTLPGVDRAVRTARAEAEALRIHRERVDTAQASLDTLLRPEHTPAHFEAAVENVMLEAPALDHHAEVTAAVQAVSAAVVAHTIAFGDLEFTVPEDDDPHVLEALVAEVREVRETLDATQADLASALEAVDVAMEAAREADRRYQEALADARARFEEQRQALDARHAQANELHAQALEQASDLPDTAPSERDALAQAVQAVLDITVLPAGEDTPEGWDRAAEAARLQVTLARDVDLVAPLQALEEAMDEGRRLAEIRRRRLAAAGEALEELTARLEAQRDLTSELLARAREESADFPDDAALPLVALEASCEALTQAQLPAELPEDPEEAETAVERATALVEQLAEQDPEELLEEVRRVVAEVREAARLRARSIAQSQAALDALRERATTGLERTRTCLEEARRVAVEHPLEAGLPLAALEAAFEGLEVVVVPEQVPDDPGRAAELVLDVAGALEDATHGDPEELLAEVQQAVEQAVREARARSEALADANERAQIARRRLETRQEEARARAESLDHAARWPEVGAAWAALEAGLDGLEALSINATPHSDLDEAREAAAEAERVAAGPPDLDVLFDAVGTALEAAVTSRRQARERYEQAAARTERRLALVEALPDPDTLPGADPIRAAYKALTKVQDELRQAIVDVPEPDAPTDTLTQCAEAAERVAEAAEARDLEGLLEELREAIDGARQAAEREEAQRVATIDQARATLQSAIEQVDAGLADRTEALASVADDPDPGGHRSAARADLEQARAVRRELESIRSTLSDDLPATEAISVAFDAEIQLQAATTHLEAVDHSLTAMRTDAEQLASSREEAADLIGVVREALESTLAVLADIPAPEGDEATALREQLDTDALAVEALRATTELAHQAVLSAQDGATATTALGRLAEIRTELRDRFDSAQRTTGELRTANRRHAERVAAARREALAADRERARLAAERAERALEDLGQVLEDTTEDAQGQLDDSTIDELLGALARQNEALLARVDRARTHAADAQDADEPGEHAQLAIAEADHAERSLAQARQASAAVAERLEAIRQAAEQEQRDRDAAILAERDRQLPPMRAYVAKLAARLDRYPPPERSEDEALQEAVERVLGALEATREAQQDAEDALGTAASARPADVQDFLRDAERAVATARTTAGSLKSAIQKHHVAKAEADERRAALDLEEARGRAWEAYQLAQGLASDLARARASLPDPPASPPPRLRQALDRLAEVERRLWRAGQRADDANERAARSTDLESARSAADAAEKAVGSASRWEREIKRVVDAVADQIGRRSTPTPAPRSERMRNLRRGRLQADRERTPAPPPSRATPAPAPSRATPAPAPSRATPAPAPRRSTPAPAPRRSTPAPAPRRSTPAPAPSRATAPPDEPTNPTEALLQRLRRGRRAAAEPEPETPPRITPVAPLDPVEITKPPPAQDYPSLGSFEDYQATAVERSPALPLDAHAPIGGRQRRRRPARDPDSETQVGGPAEDLDPTHVGPPPLDPPGPKEDDPDFEDRKTQAVNREMIEAMLGMTERKPAWGEEDESTRWETGSDDDR